MPSPSSDIRQHILDTAKPIILGKGFSAVGLNELLSAAQVPKGSFYHYFKSKEAFGEALLVGYFDHYLTRLDEILSAPGATAAQCLVCFWQGWLESQCGEDVDGKCLVVKLGGEVSDLSEPMRLALQRGTARIVQRLAQCISEGQADGSLAQVADAGMLALQLYNQWLGATVLSKISRQRQPLEAAMAMTQHLLHISP